MFRIVTMLWAGRVRNSGSIPGRVKRYLRSPAYPAFCSVGTGPRSPGTKVPEREADHCSFSAVMVCAGTTVSVPGIKLISMASC